MAGAVTAHNAAAFKDQEFVADELALLMDVHPATARGFLVDALRADALPALMGSWEAGELTDRLTPVVSGSGRDRSRRAARQPRS